MEIHNLPPEIAQILIDLDIEIQAKLDTDGLIRIYYTFSDAQLALFIDSLTNKTDNQTVYAYISQME